MAVTNKNTPNICMGLGGSATNRSIPASALHVGQTMCGEGSASNPVWQ